MSPKAFAPAAERNRSSIAEVLRDVLPTHALVLEVASGSGQHAVFFAQNFPHIEWQPSDADSAAVKSIAAWREEADLPNLLAPIELDVTRAPWPVAAADLVVSINLIHIAPWEACTSLMKGAAALLPTGSLLFLYGPFFQKAVSPAPSNVEFDRSLRAKDARWGVRYLEDVTAEAQKAGFQLGEVVPMPANNLSVLFTKI